MARGDVGAGSVGHRRTMDGVRPMGKGSAVVLVAVPLLLGLIGGGAIGYMIAPAAPAAVDTPEETADVAFTLRAFLSGFVGVGGSIDGIRNPTLLVDVGDRVSITVQNGEVASHDLRVEGYGVKTELLLSQGDIGVVTFAADRQGSFFYYCTVPGHRQAGMEGTLIVGEPSAPPPGPAKPVDVADIARNATDLPPPLNRNFSTTVHIFMEAVEVVAEIEPGTTFDYWTYNASVPGPFFRVRVNDSVVVHFKNNASSVNTHSVDFHAVTGPGGGAVAVQTPPGGETSFTFKALNPGVYVYHCASPHIPSHVAMGMYGLILVEPESGLPGVDREFYVMQGEFYTKWPVHTEGHQEFDGETLRDENPAYVVFNGRFQALTGNESLRANVNETVRIFFGVGGPNLISSFHVIGEIFDRVYLMGDLVSAPQQSVQTTAVVPGGAVAVEFRVEVPGTYFLVDHSLVRAIDKGALGFLVAEGPANPEVFDY